MITRTLVLATLLGSGALSIAVFGQPPTEPPAGAIAATKIERVKENLYVITGSDPGDNFSGGNTAVFVTDTGVTLVDTKLPGFGPTIIERIRAVTDKPVIRVINTHAHADHTGGNVFFLPTAETIVQENAHATMLKARNKAPRRAFKDRMTIGSGPDQVDLYYFGRGHTNGDTFVVFTTLRTLHAGDQFPWKALPFIDAGIGGSMLEHPKTLRAALQTIRAVDTVVGGHLPVATWADFREYADFVQDFVAYAERAMKAGKSVDEASAEYRVPPRFKGYSAAHPNLSVRTNMELAYNELSKQ
jgi:glyoxylase-like metal-dependent hydrolase (beta-lactamase superfamily II)